MFTQMWHTQTHSSTLFVEVGYNWTGWDCGLNSNIATCLAGVLKRERERELFSAHRRWQWSPDRESPQGVAFCMAFSYLWEIFQGVNYRGRVIVAHACLWIQGSTQTHTEYAASSIFVHTHSLLLIEAIWQRLIFFHFGLLIIKKTMIHNLSADGGSLLSLSFLLTLTILRCLIHAN